MAVALGARASAQPLPTGQVMRVIGGGPDGALPWPSDIAYFWANASQTRAMQIGPVTIAERCFLCARAWLIEQSAGGVWQNGVMMLRLTDGAGTEVSDIPVHSRSYVYGTSETDAHVGGGWNQLVNETMFNVAPGSYFVQMLGGGGAGNYYCSQAHLGMVGWTFGEGVV